MRKDFICEDSILYFQLFHEEVSKVSERAREWSMRASKASVGKWSPAEQVSGVSGASE